MTTTHFNTKDRILGAAEELFAQYGFAGTSLRQVTSRDDAEVPRELRIAAAYAWRLIILAAALAGFVYLLGRLGGLWRITGAVLGLVPTPVGDTLYDGVAAIRYRLFARPAEACPIVPAVLRQRFDA